MKTTKKDFEKFEQYCNVWCDKLGVKSWSRYYAHEQCDDVYAKTLWNSEGRVSTTILNTYWDDLRKKTDDEINRLALHETLHLLLADLTAQAFSRYTTVDAINTAEHAIIRQLENIVALDS